MFFQKKKIYIYIYINLFYVQHNEIYVVHVKKTSGLSFRKVQAPSTNGPNHDGLTDLICDQFYSLENRRVHLLHLRHPERNWMTYLTSISKECEISKLPYVSSRKYKYSTVFPIKDVQNMSYLAFIVYSFFWRSTQYAKIEHQQRWGFKPCPKIFNNLSK